MTSFHLRRTLNYTVGSHVPVTLKQETFLEDRDITFLLVYANFSIFNLEFGHQLIDKDPQQIMVLFYALDMNEKQFTG